MQIHSSIIPRRSLVPLSKRRYLFRMVTASFPNLDTTLFSSRNYYYYNDIISSSSVLYPQQQQLRSFSSKATLINKNTTKNTKNSNDNDDMIVLYERDSERNKLPRAAFGFSIVNTTYWLWYALDFIPTVNASPIDDLHIDPMIGVGGIVLGLLINTVTGLYPASLVSKLSYSRTTNSLHLWGHDVFPWMRPQSNTTQPIEYPLGTLTIANKSSNDAQRLLNDPLSYQGHLGLKEEVEKEEEVLEGEKKKKKRKRRIPLLLMEIQEPRRELFLTSDKTESQKDKQILLLLQTLLDPQAVSRTTNAKKGGRVSGGGSSVKKHRGRESGSATGGSLKRRK